MKRVTMELGGHAPALVFDDADLDVAAKVLAANKYRNAGQVCVAPTRFLVQERVYEEFVTRFVAASEAIKVGDGLLDGTTMGPLANDRRVQAMDSLIADAVQRGGVVRTGGARIGNKGNFYQPTVLTDVPQDARIMNEEPFGPVAVMMPFRNADDAIKEANRLPMGWLPTPTPGRCARRIGLRRKWRRAWYRSTTMAWRCRRRRSAASRTAATARRAASKDLRLISAPSSSARPAPDRDRATAGIKFSRWLLIYPLTNRP